ncbi:MAG TPA: hypothetical protein VJ281_04585 [Chthoniobacterales bacterium]|jgi:hypothetical protein|nr:hypothetical protein [Chthoniobacterales bacterium]
MNPPSKNSGVARDVDLDLDRLLRSASKAKDEAPAEMPFGFDTRIVALSRKNGNGSALAGVLRYVALAAAAVILLASAGAYLEFNRNADPIIGAGNEYAIADSVIQNEVAP